jgi:hypothetical protein
MASSARTSTAEGAAPSVWQPQQEHVSACSYLHSIPRGRLEGFLVVDYMPRAGRRSARPPAGCRRGRLWTTSTCSMPGERAGDAAEAGRGPQRRQAAPACRGVKHDGPVSWPREHTSCAITCKFISTMRRLRGTASLDAPHFRALDSKMSSFPEFRRVSGNGLGTAKCMPGDGAETIDARRWPWRTNTKRR